MRAAPSVLCCGVMTLSRTNLPLAAIAWLVTLAVLPRTCTTVVKLVPSAETWMSKSRVFQVVLSPPAPACRTVNDTIDPRRAQVHLQELGTGDQRAPLVAGTAGDA